MISVSVLEERMGDSEWIAVTPAGAIVEMEVPQDAGPATMVVSPVTDALKLGDSGLLTGSLDRDQTWSVEAFVLNRVIVSQLEREEIAGEELIVIVEKRGHSWQLLTSSSE